MTEPCRSCLPCRFGAPGQCVALVDKMKDAGLSYYASDKALIEQTGMDYEKLERFISDKFKSEFEADKDPPWSFDSTTGDYNPDD